jgi:hypothetical protein
MENTHQSFNFKLLIGSVIFIIVAGGIYYFINKGSNSSTTTNLTTNNNGSQSCVTSEGYSWCGVMKKCIKISEEKCEAENTTKSTLSETQARVIAENTCIKGGETLNTGYYNSGTKTWWFDANLNSVNKKICNPACVVSEETNTAEINYRCTGLK